MGGFVVLLVGGRLSCIMSVRALLGGCDVLAEPVWCRFCKLGCFPVLQGISCA